MPDNAPHNALRHYVSGAVARGEATPIVEMPTPAAVLARVEFDHPFTVTPAGEITDAPSGIYAPECYHDPEADISLAGAEDVWEALTGYTGQWSYSGAVMHSSEFVGGRLASDILTTPGTYVLVTVEVLPGEGCPACGSAIDYCPGHGEMGDPDGAAILARHDADDHSGCASGMCEDIEPAGWAVLRMRGEA